MYTVIGLQAKQVVTLSVLHSNYSSMDKSDYRYSLWNWPEHSSDACYCPQHSSNGLISFDKMFLHYCTEVLMPLLAVAFISKLIVQTRIWIVSTVYRLGESLKLCWVNVSAHASVFEDRQCFFISFMLHRTLIIIIKPEKPCSISWIIW